VLVTVLTPTFNRSLYLERLFESLQSQHFKAFEWLVVDDGSTDETESLVARLAGESEFEVRYVRQHNQGKHIALNTGVRHASGEYTAVIDADDWYEPNALQRLVAEWEMIGDPSSYAEVQALCADPSGNLIGDRFPCDTRLDSDAFEMAYIHRVGGDKVGMQRTAVLREFPFPDEFHGVYVSEALIWFQIAEKYQTRYINEILGRKEYLAGGITDNEYRKAIERAGPRRQYFRQVAQTRRPLPKRDRMRAYANWARNARLSGVGLRDEAATARDPIAFLTLAPFGALMSVRDRRRVKTLERQDQSALD
jgi:glycosyltransferase involved in cell wall biosynthesis